MRYNKLGYSSIDVDTIQEYRNRYEICLRTAKSTLNSLIAILGFYTAVAAFLFSNRVAFRFNPIDALFLFITLLLWLFAVVGCFLTIVLSLTWISSLNDIIDSIKEPEKPYPNYTDLEFHRNWTEKLTMRMALSEFATVVSPLLFLLALILALTPLADFWWIYPTAIVILAFFSLLWWKAETAAESSIWRAVGKGLNEVWDLMVLGR